MANSVGLAIGVKFLADGVSAVFTFDMLNDPYFLQNPGGVNWPPGRRGTLPTVAVGPSGASTSISGSVVTITYSSPPTAGVFDADLDLFF